MASSIVFTDSGGSVKVEWSDGSAKSAYFQKEDYSLWRSGTQFHLVPSSANLTDFGQFQNGDLATPYADADALEAAIGPLFTAVTVISGNIVVTGVSTAIRQDAQTTKLTDIQSSVGDVLSTCYDVSLVPVVDKNTGVAAFARYRSLKYSDAFDLAPTALLDYILADGTVAVGLTDADVWIVGTGVIVSVAPLTTQGAEQSIPVPGTSAGSFTYHFGLGAGTSGILTLYGSNDGDYFAVISATASLLADTDGVISWSVPYRLVKAVFTTQVGAGSSFRGGIYAI